jgi:hypothetical protein
VLLEVETTTNCSGHHLPGLVTMVALFTQRRKPRRREKVVEQSPPIFSHKSSTRAADTIHQRVRSHLPPTSSTRATVVPSSPAAAVSLYTAHGGAVDDLESSLRGKKGVVPMSYGLESPRSERERKAERWFNPPVEVNARSGRIAIFSGG